MEPLNLPTYSFNIKPKGERLYIFDEIRKKYILLTPEEWVRQNFVQYLSTEKHFPKSLVRIEMHFKLNKLSKRGDIVLFGRNGEPKVLVECKSHTVRVSQKVFDQVSRYNLKFRVDYLIVTNGLEHYCCKMDYENQTYRFLDEIPGYEELESKS